MLEDGGYPAREARAHTHTHTLEDGGYPAGQAAGPAAARKKLKSPMYTDLI